MKRILVLFAIILAITGCASASREINNDQVSKIKEGITTKQEVYDLIGSPDSVTNLGSGAASWSYSYTRTAKAASFMGGTNSQYLMIIFGTDNVVKKIIGNHIATE